MPGLVSPEWLLLVAAILGIVIHRGRPRIGRPLRALALGLLALALAGLRLGGVGRGVDLWVLVDRSPSARDLLVPRLQEMEGLLESGMSRGDRITYVDFAEEVRRRIGGEAESFAGLGEETLVATAVRYALSGMDPGRSSRILLLSDGHSTEPLEELSERLERQGVPLDLRLVAPSGGADFAVESLDLPERGKPREPFAIEIRFRGDEERDVPFALLRNGRLRGRVTVPIRGGAGVVRFSDRLPADSSLGGALRYDVQLEIEDPVPGNGAASGWIELEGGPRVLLVTAYSEDPLAPVLRKQDLEVAVASDPGGLGLEHLSGARAVILNNVPASSLAPEFLAGLDSWVRLQGGGLLMAGGEYSFGSGGFFDSPIDPLLPVSMELREEHRLLSVAMAIVMDRSGSMAAGVAGGRTKMDLANEGAARSIELLGSKDAVAVFAVDSEAHPIVPLTPLAAGREPILDKVRRIDSMGGGIYLHEGLSAAWRELARAREGQRHVILFADAADSEEPGDYPKLLAEMTGGGATVSVIGLGSEDDADAPLLKDIARLGKGRIFFNADPASLPALFAQETVAVARSAFVEELTGVAPSAGWLEISERPLEGLAVVDGYNLSYLREEAAGALFTTDEYRAPLVAFWNRGAGRVAAVSFPLNGAHSDRVRRWRGYGDFVQTLSRWLLGDAVPPGIGLSTRLDGTVLQVDLWFDESWEERLSRSPAEVLLVGSSARDPEMLVWDRLAPGHFRGEKRLRSGELYRGAARIGTTVLPFGPLAAPVGEEWRFDPERLAELRNLSRASGGVERTDLASVWEERISGSDLDLTPVLLWGFLALFLVEAYLSRLGWRMPEVRFGASRPASVPVAIQSTKLPEVPISPEPDPASEKRRERFARAKHGR